MADSTLWSTFDSDDKTRVIVPHSQMRKWRQGQLSKVRNARAWPRKDSVVCKAPQLMFHPCLSFILPYFVVIKTIGSTEGCPPPHLPFFQPFSDFSYPAHLGLYRPEQKEGAASQRLGGGGTGGEECGRRGHCSGPGDGWREPFPFLMPSRLSGPLFLLIFSSHSVAQNCLW